jgi:hypothetical protein
MDGEPQSLPPSAFEIGKMLSEKPTIETAQKLIKLGWTSRLAAEIHLFKPKDQETIAQLLLANGRTNDVIQHITSFKLRNPEAFLADALDSLPSYIEPVIGTTSGQPTYPGSNRHMQTLISLASDLGTYVENGLLTKKQTGEFGRRLLERIEALRAPLEEYYERESLTTDFPERDLTDHIKEKVTATLLRYAQK